MQPESEPAHGQRHGDASGRDAQEAALRFLDCQIEAYAALADFDREAAMVATLAALLVADTLGFSQASIACMQKSALAEARRKRS